MIFARLKDKETSKLNIGAYTSALNFLKDYIVEFGRSDVKFAPFFRTKKLLQQVNTELEEVDLLNGDLIIDLKLNYVYQKIIQTKRNSSELGKRTWFIPMCFRNLVPDLRTPKKQRKK
ncbi:unnamed protein product [Lactuca saligna]|uniref:Uncharacterized protein n=1 Tax=Lactuca saligna TaxID=75948 RepID=A0AA35UQ26_LACSI|nr:unnamed protein product [Lactuca saligna]